MRWSNVPIPEPHIGALVAAASLHAVLPLRVPLGAGLGRGIGGALVAAGIGLAGWAVASAGDADVEADESLVTTGAYAFSRNPMYVGWSAGVLGVACWTRSAWLMATWAVAVRLLDREVGLEESKLRSRFGAEHASYVDRVPRYLSRRLTRTAQTGRCG